jgi:hypothetical protein
MIFARQNIRNTIITSFGRQYLLTKRISSIPLSTIIYNHLTLNEIHKRNFIK